MYVMCLDTTPTCMWYHHQQMPSPHDATKTSYRVIFGNFFENQLHKLGSTGRANLFACDFGKQGLVLIITSEIELEISRPLCKGFI